MEAELGLAFDPEHFGTSYLAFLQLYLNSRGVPVSLS